MLILPGHSWRAEKGPPFRMRSMLSTLLKMSRRLSPLVLVALAACQTAPVSRPVPAVDTPPVAAAVEPAVPKPPPRPPRVGLALGGGAARGFAHIGVIQVLEENGIHPDLVV